MAVLDHHGVVEHGHVDHAAVAVPGVEVAAEQGVLLGAGRFGSGVPTQSALRARMRRWLALGSNSSTTTRTETQARHVSQAAGTRWSASGGNRPWVRISFRSRARRPTSG